MIIKREKSFLSKVFKVFVGRNFFNKMIITNKQKPQAVTSEKSLPSLKTSFAFHLLNIINIHFFPSRVTFSI